jgi:hypothetical protein
MDFIENIQGILSIKKPSARYLQTVKALSTVQLAAILQAL